MIVVDTNILAYLYLPCEYTTAAEALLERDPDFAAPILWRSEFRNILAGYLCRRTLTFEQACALQAEAEHLLDGAEFEVDSKTVLELVRGSALGVRSHQRRDPFPDLVFRSANRAPQGGEIAQRRK
ncbi:MAG: type II toxin-antitoxin system VapC family toxin [Thiotrichales bacterium]